MIASHFAAAQSDVDLFCDAALASPYPIYRELRDLGPAVWLSRFGIWFIGRYADARSAALDWRSYSSAKGVTLNPIVNAAWTNTLIASDPPVHSERRKYFTDRLGPRHLKHVEQTINQHAEELVDRITALGSFDGATDVAHDLPVNVIMNLIGWPHHVRGELLAMAKHAFDAGGPCTPRTERAMADMGRMAAMIAQVYDEGSLIAGGFGSSITESAQRGEITREDALGLLTGYVVAAFDTTVNAIASGLWLFSEHQDQWDLVRQEPERVPAALAEILRIEAPAQGMGRCTTRDIEFSDGTTIPEGARVFLCFGSANRDERKYADPDDFDITRNPSDHLGFGVGPHSCAGQGLARLEALAVFNALARRGLRFEPAGTPIRELNNLTRGFAQLPLRVI